MKPSILVISDFPNWAYSNIQNFIFENLSDEYDIYLDYLVFHSINKSKNPIKLAKLLISKLKYSKTKKNNDYDIVFYLGFYFDSLINVKWKSKKIIKGIYTDSFPPKNSNFQGTKNQFIKKFFSDTDAIVCGSPLIKEFYQESFQKTYHANNIVNQNLFKRKSQQKDNFNFTIGWTGNPKREFKGFYTHVKPAAELLIKKYKNINFKTRFSGPIETLPNFFDDVDVCIIASDADAGPSLFSEASLMDIPCVSTNIGKPNLVIKHAVNGFFVNRNIKDIFNCLEKLYLDRNLLKSMKSRIRSDYLEVFNKKDMVNRWKKIFEDVLSNK